jgi:hypothetical protein
MAQKIIQLHEGWEILTAFANAEGLTLNQALDVLRKLESAPEGAFEDGTAGDSEETPPEESDANNLMQELIPANDSEAHEEPASDSQPDGGIAAVIAISTRLRSVLACGTAFDSAARAADRTANVIRDIEESAAYKALEAHELLLGKRALTKRVRSTSFRTVAREIASLKPLKVCPDCKGIEPSPDAEWCNQCGGKGFLIADDLRE